MAEEADNMATVEHDYNCSLPDGAAAEADVEHAVDGGGAGIRDRPSELYQAPLQEYSEEFAQDVEAMKAMGLPLSFTNRQAIDLDEVSRSRHCCVSGAESKGMSGKGGVYS